MMVKGKKNSVGNTFFKFNHRASKNLSQTLRLSQTLGSLSCSPNIFVYSLLVALSAYISRIDETAKINFFGIHVKVFFTLVVYFSKSQESIQDCIVNC